MMRMAGSFVSQMFSATRPGNSIASVRSALQRQPAGGREAGGLARDIFRFVRTEDARREYRASEAASSR